MKYLNAPPKPENYNTPAGAIAYFADVVRLAKETGKLVKVCNGFYFLCDAGGNVWQISSRDDEGQRNHWDITKDGTFEYLDPKRTLRDAVEAVKGCGQ